ncbi:MAG: RraA family protein [Candidatus Latescibacteria bacterium]|nr:RraA family protein [Candidatus Latescibacterota bacterium]
MSQAGLSQADLNLLRQYDTPTICNVVEIFALQSQTKGYMDGRIRACFPEMPPMVGYAVTATWRAAFPAPAGGYMETFDAQVATFADVPGPPVVVFQDMNTPPVAASFGEIMCATYQAFGAQGLVTGGSARDLEQVRALGFPAFSDGVNPSHGYGHISDLQQPVQVGGLTVRPGTLLHGDANGVTAIPNAIAADVAHACGEYVAAEDIVLNYLKQGNPTPAGLAQAWAQAKAQIQALTERVQAKRKA